MIQTGPKVLHDISFHIKAGERVGVGETPLLPSDFNYIKFCVQLVARGVARVV
jgi:hypothetical protein